MSQLLHEQYEQTLRENLRLERENAALRAELEGVRKDAERYRWLRDIGDSTWQPLIERSRLAFPHVPTTELPPMIDEIIDAAIAQGKV